MRRHTCWTHELPNGNEVELPVTPTDWLEDTIEVVEKPDGNYLVGYLVHDAGCMNPLEDGDGMGSVHHHPRSRYGRRDSDYYEALGLDSHGDPVYDTDKLQALWHTKVMSLPLELFEVQSSPVPSTQLRTALAEMTADDATVENQCYYAWSEWLEEEDQDKIWPGIEAALGWNYEMSIEECREPGDKYAVLLDVYDHSGRSYNIAGTGPQCRWDTSHAEAIWVADTCCRDEIARRAIVYAFGEVVKRELRTKTEYSAVPDPYSDKFIGDDGAPLGVFEHWHEAFDSLAKHTANYTATTEMIEKGFERALLEVAEGCVEQYDEWQQGNCFGVVSFECTPEGEIIDEGEVDSCWGFVGRKWAEEEMQSRLTIREEKEVVA